MTYLVTIDRVVPGTIRPRTTTLCRTTRLDRAVAAATAASRDTATTAAVSSTSRHGRTLLGTARAGTFRPTRAYIQHATPKENTMATATTAKKTTPKPAAEKPKPKAAPKAAAAGKFIAHGWSISRGKVTTKTTHETLEHATRAAEKALTGDADLREVSITQVGSKDRTIVRRGKIGEFKHVTSTSNAPAPDTSRNKNTEKTTRAAAPAVKRSSIKTWADVLDLADGQIRHAHRDGRKQLKLADDTYENVLAAAKSTAKTKRYDGAYLRFLAGRAGSFPSNPTSTGGLTGEERTARRAAIRKAAAKLLVSK